MSSSEQIWNESSDEFKVQQILRELLKFNNEYNLMEEKAMKLKIETALLSVELSTKTDSIDWIESVGESRETISELESNIESKPNSEQNPINCQSIGYSSDVRQDIESNLKMDSNQ